jgi:serine-type D-Ala-D-Ala endopeptidase (penicillin-binding protein 7)
MRLNKIMKQYMKDSLQYKYLYKSWLSVAIFICMPSFIASATAHDDVTFVTQTQLPKLTLKSSQYHSVQYDAYGNEKADFQALKYKEFAPPTTAVRIREPKVVNKVDYSHSQLELSSTKALVYNQLTREVVYGKNVNKVTPIASVTKLMTAMVMLDAHLPMDELISITREDIDYLKGTRSRLSVGTSLTRAELLQLALMASENRAASALARNYPGGFYAFMRAMNQKAQALGMRSTYFVDATGLDSANTSTAEDLVRMVSAAYEYPEIRQVSTTPSQAITLYGRQGAMNFVNTNALVRNGDWIIGLSKTGFINEAGRCLVMQAEIAGQPMIIVLLDSVGKLTRVGDANRIRKWLERQENTTFASNVNG